MSEIEAKINIKLQEIESLFNDRPGAPIIIKNNSSALMHSGAVEENEDNEENIYKKGSAGGAQGSS